MYKEIGSEFWISDLVTSETKTMPEWLSSWGEYILTSSGRGALSLILQKVEPRSKIALLPSYICESVISPFLEYGYSCLFYDIDENLEVLIEDINVTSDIGIFMHMGYFGFPTNNSLEDITEKFKKKSTIIIEDITHTLFSDYIRSNHNDYYIASLRKWMGLPSGGFLSSPHGDINSELEKNYTFSNIRKHALLKKARYIEGSNDELKPQILELFAEAEEQLDGDVLPYGIDELSKTLIRKSNINDLIERRKSNFEFLLNELRELKFIKPVFEKLPKQVCPLFFPVYIKGDRLKIRKYLSDNKIYCPIHWPIPEQVKILKNYKVNYIYNNILSIPCDQRYENDDMSKIVKVLYN
ncbi:MAG: hypothetical protein GX323_11090 [Clostridiales bacterium]|nr:hypothetical protein [Clostridiales bacterium]